jgi:adenylate cyclase
MLTEYYLMPSQAHINILVVIFAGLITLIVGQRKMNSLSLLGVYFLITFFYITFNQILFTYYGIRMNLVFPLFTLFSGGTFIVNYRYFVEERKARNVRKMFSSYVTERVVNELIKNPEMAKLGGDRREVTVFFSDIRSFTTFSERHEPEEVVAMLNEYLNAMTDIVFKWEGTLDKFIGDAVVAFWGAPLPQDNHAELAIRCSLNMIDKLKELQDKWRSEGKVPLEIGIGLNTGEVLVGNIGAEGKKMDYTVIGDHVNLAARVESLTKKYSARILITEFTLEKLRDIINENRLGHILAKGLERVIVKGKDKPVGLYKISSLDTDGKSVITDPDKDKVVKLTEK